MSWSTLKTKLKIVALDAFDLLSFLVFVTWVVLFIRFFIFNPYTVVGKSMEPTFSQSDFIVVDKITPKLGKLKRSDIIVFVPQGKDLPFIKRIVWVPWDTVKIHKWWVYICENIDADPLEDCEHLEEYYLPDDRETSVSMCKKDVFEVQEWWYFVLWDNRDHSTDSRCCFGLWCIDWWNYLVYEKDMIGKVAVRIYPNLEPYW